MAVSYNSIGTVATGQFGSTGAVGMASGLATGDLALIMVVNKPPDGTSGGVVNTPTGWTLLGTIYGGGGSYASGTGPTRQTWFSRVKDAGWSAGPSLVTPGGIGAIAAAMIRVSGATSYSVAFATGTYGVAGTVTNCASTLTTDPGITSGDLLLGGYSTESATISWSSQGVTAPGATIGAATERSGGIATSLAFDVGGEVFTASATAGTSTGAPTTAVTANSTTRGTAALVRVRDAATPTTITGTQATETDTARAGTTLLETRRNLTTNPSFETNTTEWAAVSGSDAPVQSTTRAYSGSNSMLTARGAGAAGQWASNNLSAKTVAGQTYTASAWLWVPAGNPSDCGLRVAGTGVVTLAESYTPLRDQWVRVSVTFTRAASGTLFFQVSGGTSGQVWVDAVMLNVGTEANAYFDGDTADSAPVVYEWTGAAHASASVQMAPYVAPATVNGGQAPETSTALAGVVLAGMLILGGQATETDVARAGTTSQGQIVPGGRAVETDTARAGTVTVGAVIAGGQATETDEAFAGEVADANAIIGGQALETDEALAGSIVLGYGATDTTNRVGGRRRGGYAVATWEPPVAVAPATIVHGHAADFALAFGPVTMNGTQPEHTTDRVEKTRLRDRIIVGGVDITYFRDKPTPLPSYQLVSPLLYGPATLRLPQIAIPFEEVGTGDHSWCRPEKTVLVQRVDAETGEVMATDYRGVIIALDTSGRDLTVEIGGEASGRAALMERQIPIFRFTNDLGVYAYRAIRGLGLPFEPYLGPDTGIKMGRFGGTGYLDYISQLVARAWTRAGNQWTIMPVNGVYRMFRKDTATIDATAYLDDSMTVGNLRRDLAEEPNRIYATVITPEGQRVDGAVFPGLQKSHPAPYPFNDNRNFGVGTTNAGTDTGDGISVMIDKLRIQKYMDAPDAPGGYDADAAAGIRQLQDDADLPITGTMTPATWRALYDLDATGFSLRQSTIEPAAQKGYTKQWIKSGSGAIMRRHVGYDPRRLKRDRNIDLGSGFTIAQRLEFAQAERDVAEDNWVGTITFHTGGLVNGTHSPGDAVTDANLKRARALRPGMNLFLPYSPGGPIIVHISAISVDEDGKVTATVDTRARDSMAVWEVLARNRESRANPARQWVQQHRASGTTRDAIDGWYAVGGRLGSKVTIPGHKWTVFEVVAGQEGTIARLALETSPNAEFVVAVFGRGGEVLPKRLAREIGNPLTKRGARKWADEGVRNKLDLSHLMLYVAGDSEQPCGYFPRNKRPDTVITDETNPDYDPTADPDHTGTDDEPTIEVETETGSITPLTGKWKDDAGFGYRTFAQPVLYVAVYADRDTAIPAGRIMWPQLEAGA